MFTNGENHWGKTLPSEFKVTIPKNPLLSKQEVTSKGIQYLIPTYSWTLTPNTQLDLFCSDNHFFQCTAPSTWLTNQRTDPSTWLTTNLRRMLVAKFFSSSTRWRSWSSLVTKPYDVQMQQLFQEKDELRHMSLVTICLWKTFSLNYIHLHQLWRPLK